jgi:hypothetical protein
VSSPSASCFLAGKFVVDLDFGLFLFAEHIVFSFRVIVLVVAGAGLGVAAIAVSALGSSVVSMLVSSSSLSSFLVGTFVVDFHFGLFLFVEDTAFSFRVRVVELLISALLVLVGGAAIPVSTLVSRVVSLSILSLTLSLLSCFLVGTFVVDLDFGLFFFVLLILMVALERGGGVDAGTEVVVVLVVVLAGVVGATLAVNISASSSSTKRCGEGCGIPSRSVFLVLLQLLLLLLLQLHFVLLSLVLF